MQSKVLTEKIHNKMGKTTCFKVKENEKTLIVLDKEILASKMADIKSCSKTEKNTGIFSKVLSRFRINGNGTEKLNLE